MFILQRSLIFDVPKNCDSQPVRHALASLRRDLNACLLPNETKTNEAEEKAKRADKSRAQKISENPAPACLHLQKKDVPAESYVVTVSAKSISLTAGDPLGFVYGIYAISKNFLGVLPFWFFMDQPFSPVPFKTIKEGTVLTSPTYRVKYRGWFVNDEVLLDHWSVDRDKKKPFALTFETLLRLGGNMVIPGTGENARKYRQLAADMGLIITQHHAEPLGAEMFLHAYPDLEPSYDKYPDKFQKLWEEAIKSQRGMKVLWNLGFRGQGDVPFWHNDHKYADPASRGQLISELIQLQYDMVKRADPTADCCVNLYGEVLELYRGGFLTFPNDVIKIWADNGFGTMVSRRQDNHNPRIPAIPRETEVGPHGLYYHVSFYDLQAANHITMLQCPPELIKEELQKALAAGVDRFWLINCSNVKPHVYYLDFVSRLWQSGDIDIAQHAHDYAAAYYGQTNADRVAGLIAEYHRCSLSYGPHKDDLAGDQFENHVARCLISQYMKDPEHASEELQWFVKTDSLQEQIKAYAAIYQEGHLRYQAHRKHCIKAWSEMSAPSDTLLADTIDLCAAIHQHGSAGAWLVTQALAEAYQKNWQRAFYNAGLAREEYLAADHAMRAREHGKWHLFYQNECEVDCKQTAWVLAGFMSYLRNLGDGPHFFQWQRDFLDPPEDSKIRLILTSENHRTDEEIFALMKERWQS